MTQPAVQRSTRHQAWRFLRRYREVIMIVLTLAVSLVFVFYGLGYAIHLETMHPQWFTDPTIR